ncbi:MAG: hypothetical protein Q8M15_12135 [Bacteroidota bacterium]|nr:hypothetical protein [Bacteroidota bacterium]
MKTFKHKLFIFVMVILLLPVIQQVLHFCKVAPLNGDYKKAEKPEISFANWFKSEYQIKEVNWQNEYFGFRNILVRLHNQVGYVIYKKPYANQVVFGKNGFLFAQNYIDAFTGKDFIGETAIGAKLQKIKLVTEILKRKNISMLCVLAPGKASFFHEFIEDKDASIKGRTNYSVYAKLLKDSNIPYIDFKQWFDTLKVKQTHFLFPKNGIHWSSYGAILAADSLIKKIGEMRNIDIPKLIIDRVVLKDELSETDNDVGRGMNLLVGPKTYPMPYAEYHFENDRNKTKPRVIVVADSYYWTLPTFEMREKSFNGVNFLYYNKELHPTGPEMIPMSKVNLKELILNTDMVVLLCTDGNLSGFDWNFSQNVFDLFNGEYIQRLKETKTRIQKDAAWFKLIQKKAIARKISTDSMLQIDAMFVIEEENKK